MSVLLAAKRAPGAIPYLSFSWRIAATRRHASNLRSYHASTQERGIGIEDAFYVPSPHRVADQQRPRQLNILEQSYKPEFYEAISKIMKLRRKYIEDRCLFVDGTEMRPLLKFLGAKEEDFPMLETVSNSLSGDPTLPFRLTKNCRFCYDFDTQSVRRLEFQPFALSAEEDFKRHDSGQIRVFDEVQNDLQLNTAFQALLVFKAMIFRGMTTRPRPKFNYDTNKWVCTLFNVRTVTTPDQLGEPALEGVHTDGVDHTMTTYLGSKNMTPDSAATFLHSMDEVTGIPCTKASPEFIKLRSQHRHFLDTLVIADNELKHSLTPVHAMDPSKPAFRDMLVFFTRKPVTADHISATIDSLNPHRDLPMEIPIFLPQ